MKFRFPWQKRTELKPKPELSSIKVTLSRIGDEKKEVHYIYVPPGGSYVESHFDSDEVRDETGLLVETIQWPAGHIVKREYQWTIRN